MLCFAVTAVSAASFNAFADNPTSTIVSVSGVSHGNVTIRTVPYGTDMSGISPSDLYTDFDHIYTNGAFTYEYVMPDSAAYGKYEVYVNDGKTQSGTFMYYNTDDADALMSVINASTDGASLAASIEANAATLGIDKDDSFYAANSKSAADILASNFMPFDDSTKFYNEYYTALSMSAMKGSEKSGIEALLSTYEQNMGIDYSSYNTLTEEHKSDICVLLSGMDFSKELSDLKKDGEAVSFANVIKRTTALSAVRTAANRIEIKNVFLNDYKDVLEKIITDNSSYTPSMESDVFTALANSGDFTSFEALRQSFDDAVSYVCEQNRPSRPDSSSSGGGGGGGFVSMPSGNVAPKDEYDTAGKNDDSNGSAEIKTSLRTPVLGNQAASYTDVDETSWEYGAVSVLGGNGIISGYEDGSFRSSNMIKRAEFAKLIAVAFSVNAKQAEFDDVAQSDWYHSYVSALAGAGIINGYDGIFSPDANITREDAAVIIYRLSQLLGKNYYGSANFGDLNDVSVYALTAVRSLGNAGIINGDNNLNFNPKSNLTRAEAAQLLYNFINALAKE